MLDDVIEVIGVEVWSMSMFDYPCIQEDPCSDICLLVKQGRCSNAGVMSSVLFLFLTVTSFCARRFHSFQVQEEPASAVTDQTSAPYIMG